MADKPKKVKIRYDSFHRMWTGLILVCMIVAIVASASAESSMFTIVKRTGFVVAILMLIGGILIRAWASWEEVRHAGIKANAGKRK